MKKILVPTDFSKCAGNALTYALQIAARTGASVDVLHVLRPYEGVENNIYNAMWIEQYVEAKKSALEKWTKRYAKKFGDVAVKTECRVGFTADETADAARRAHADFIALGTTGATGLKNILLGSTASAVIARTKLPVLAVPRTGSFHRLAKAVFATDFRANLESHSVSALKSLLRIEHASLDVFHVFSKTDGAPDPEKERMLQQKLDGIELRFHYSTDRDVPLAISRFADDLGAHLICTVSHQHGLVHRLFFESNARALAHRSTLPLLVLHD